MNQDELGLAAQYSSRTKLEQALQHLPDKQSGVSSNMAHSDHPVNPIVPSMGIQLVHSHGRTYRELVAPGAS